MRRRYTSALQDPVTPDTVIHMVKDRKNRAVTTRCGTQITLKQGQCLPDAWITGWENEVTCEGCKL